MFKFPVFSLSHCANFCSLQLLHIKINLKYISTASKKTLLIFWAAKISISLILESGTLQVVHTKLPVFWPDFPIPCGVLSMRDLLYTALRQYQGGALDMVMYLEVYVYRLLGYISLIYICTRNELK